MNRILNKNSLIVIYFLIVVFADITTKLWHTVSPAPSSIIKGILLIPVFIYTLKRERPFALYFILLLFLFSLGCFLISGNFFLRQLPQFFEYYTFVFFFLFFYNSPWQTLQKPLEWVFLGHAIIIMCAGIFEMEFLKTYPYSERYGYISFFNSQNEFSYILMAGVLFFYNRLNGDADYIGFAKLLFFSIAGLMVGTKAFFLFLLLFAAYVLYRKISLHYFLGVLIVIAGLLLVFSNKLFQFFKVYYADLYAVYKNDGFLSFLSSQRTILFRQRLDDYLSSNNFLNIFLGGGYREKIFEMSVMDLVAFLGITGTVGYVLIIYKNVYSRIIIGSEMKSLLLLIISISFFAGYLLDNASAQIYVLFTVLCFASKKNSVFIIRE